MNRALLALLLFFSFTTKADQWRDPDWREMIYESDVIALVEYTSDGDFFAKAKPLRVYRGEFRSGEVWISGFSNRYGPIDKMRVGDRYIVLLRKELACAKIERCAARRLRCQPPYPSPYTYTLHSPSSSARCYCTRLRTA